MNRPVLTICAAAALLAVPAFAQADAETQNAIQLTRQVIQTNRQAIVTQAMDLTGQESEAFWPLYRDWRAKVAGLGDKTVKLITDFSQQYETLTDEQAKALVDQWQKLDEDRVKLRKQYIQRFRKILPEKKVMRFFQLENKMDAVVSYELAGSIPLAE